MRKIIFLAAAMLVTMLPGAAMAADKDPCGVKMVCATNPKTVVDALMTAGYKAELGTDSGGDPKISSAANGYNFTVYFYDCDRNKDCAAIQFFVGFKAEAKNTLELVNKWNRAKRFGHMTLEEDKGLNVTYDLTTVGGLNQKNFADAIDWWATMLGELNAFFK